MCCLEVNVLHLNMCAGNRVAAVELTGYPLGLGACDITEQNVFNGDP